MPPDIAQLMATPQTIEIGGRQLMVSPLTMNDLGSLQSWIYAQIPDPVAAARRMAEGMPADVRSELFREACREERAAKAAHRIGMPAASEMVQGLMGVVELLYLSTRKHHPELTRDEMPSWILMGGAVAVERVSAHAFGVEAVLGEEEATPGPKGGAAGAGETGASASTSSS